LLLQVAVRTEDFSDFGRTTNFKVAGRYYSIADLATLRGSYSTGFRAPTPGQSNYTGIVTSFDGPTGMQVQEGTVRPTDPLAVALGGKELGPETAKNISFGFTTKPISNMSLSFDMYQIDIEGKIIKSRSLEVEDNPLYSKLAFYTNALDTKTSGYDLVVVYKMGSTNLSLAYNHNETKVVRQNKVNGLNPVSDGNVQNLEENLPRDRRTATITQDFGDALSAMIRLNYYGESIDERSQKDVIDPITFFDVELSYAINNNINLVFGANNVTNVYPNEIDTRMSQGMPYPRRSPLGYHGGMTYLKLNYNF
jgi:iron complex outermembrane receptor protein